MKSSTRSQTLEDLLHANQRRLHLLEKQAAQFGAHSDPSLLIEIEDLRHKIANIEQTLDMLVSASTSPEAAAAKPRAAVAAASRHPGINARRIMLPAFITVVLLAVAFVALARYLPSKTAVVSPTAG